MDCDSARIGAVCLLFFVLFCTVGCIQEEPQPEVIEDITIHISNESIVSIPENMYRLDFGTVPQGTITSKMMEFSGVGPMNLTVIGVIEPWVELDPASFYLNGTQNVTVKIVVPNNTEPGHYTGLIIRIA